MIDIKEENVLEIPISFNGIETGEVLRFNVDDIELPLKYDEMVSKDKQNRDWLTRQMVIIEKKQDTPTKGFLSNKEKEIIKVTKEFFEKEKDIYNMFLGENGVEKLLCGRKFSWLILYQIDEIIEKNILPHLDLTFEGLKNKMIKKYQQTDDKNVI